MFREQPPYKPGDVIGSKYQLVKVLGEGGMSVVYDAIDTTCDRKIAVKIIRPGHAGTARFSKERMQREAAVLVKLHEQTEFVVDVFTSGITDDEYQLPHYVMERLRGNSLRQFMSDQIARNVDFTMDEIAGVGIPIAVALAHAHALGVVHRDTKPENVFMAVTHDGRAAVKVLDFGICARADDEHNAAWFAGTLAYAAPEQLEGRPPVPATDVYALGLILFEMATLKLPHGRHRDDLTLERLALAVMKNPVPDIATLRLDALARFCELVGRCLALDPDLRPTAQEVAHALRDIRLSFLGALTGATASQTAATDVDGTPIAILQERLAAASAAKRPQDVRVVVGAQPVDLSARTDVSGSANGADEDVVFFRRPADVRAPDANAPRHATVPADEANASQPAPIAPDLVVTLHASSGSAPPEPADEAAATPWRYDDSVLAPEVRPLLEPDKFLRALAERDDPIAVAGGDVASAAPFERAAAPSGPTRYSASVPPRSQGPTPSGRAETAPAYESATTSEGGGEGGDIGSPPSLVARTVTAFLLSAGVVAVVALFALRGGLAPRDVATSRAVPAGMASAVSPPTSEELPIVAPPQGPGPEPAAQETSPAVLPTPPEAIQRAPVAAATRSHVAASARPGAPVRARAADEGPPQAPPSASADDGFLRDFRTTLENPPAAPAPRRAAAPPSPRSSANPSAGLPEDFKMIH